MNISSVPLSMRPASSIHGLTPHGRRFPRFSSLALILVLLLAEEVHLVLACTKERKDFATELLGERFHQLPVSSIVSLLVG